MSVAAVAAAALFGAPASVADPPIVGPPPQGGVQVQTHVPVTNAVAGARHTVHKLHVSPAPWRRIFGTF